MRSTPPSPLPVYGLCALSGAAASLPFDLLTLPSTKLFSPTPLPLLLPPTLSWSPGIFAGLKPRKDLKTKISSVNTGAHWPLPFPVGSEGRNCCTPDAYMGIVQFFLEKFTSGVQAHSFQRSLKCEDTWWTGPVAQLRLSDWVHSSSSWLPSFSVHSERDWSFSWICRHWRKTPNSLFLRTSPYLLNSSFILSWMIDS